MAALSSLQSQDAGTQRGPATCPVPSAARPSRRTLCLPWMRQRALLPVASPTHSPINSLTHPFIHSNHKPAPASPGARMMGNSTCLKPAFSQGRRAETQQTEAMIAAAGTDGWAEDFGRPSEWVTATFPQCCGATGLESSPGSRTGGPPEAPVSSAGSDAGPSPRAFGGKGTRLDLGSTWHSGC